MWKHYRFCVVFFSVFHKEMQRDLINFKAENFFLPKMYT